MKAALYLAIAGLAFFAYAAKLDELADPSSWPRYTHADGVPLKVRRCVNAGGACWGASLLCLGWAAARVAVRRSRPKPAVPTYRMARVAEQSGSVVVHMEPDGGRG